MLEFRFNAEFAKCCKKGVKLSVARIPFNTNNLQRSVVMEIPTGESELQSQGEGGDSKITSKEDHLPLWHMISTDS